MLESAGWGVKRLVVGNGDGLSSWITRQCEALRREKQQHGGGCDPPAGLEPRGSHGQVPSGGGMGDVALKKSAAFHTSQKRGWTVMDR